MNIQELLKKQQQKKKQDVQQEKSKKSKTVSLKDLSKYKEELVKKGEEDNVQQEEPKQETPKINLGNILTKKNKEENTVEEKVEKTQNTSKEKKENKPQKSQKQASKKTSNKKNTNTPVENNLPVEGFPELSTTKIYTGHIHMTVPEDDGFGKGFIVFSNNDKTYTLFVNKGLVGAELPVLNTYIQKGYNTVFCQFRVNSMEVDGRNTLYASHIVTMGESKYNQVLENLAKTAPKISFKGVSSLLSELEELGVVNENNELTEENIKDVIDALDLSGVRVSGNKITGWFK